MTSDWTNNLYFGDNLGIMRDHIPNESVDLIYLDPSFNSKATYNVLFGEKKVMKNEGAQIGAFITLEEPTKPMREEATAANRDGFYVSELYPDRQYPRVQILTIEELLDGRELKYPGEPATFRRAKRQRKGPNQDQGRIV